MENNYYFLDADKLAEIDYPIRWNLDNTKFGFKTPLGFEKLSQYKVYSHSEMIEYISDINNGFYREEI